MSCTAIFYMLSRVKSESNGYGYDTSTCNASLPLYTCPSQREARHAQLLVQLVQAHVPEIALEANNLVPDVREACEPLGRRPLGCDPAL